MDQNEERQSTQRFLNSRVEGPSSSISRMRDQANFYIDPMADPEIGYNSTWFLCNNMTPNFESISKLVKSEKEKTLQNGVDELEKEGNLHILFIGDQHLADSLRWDTS